MVIKARIHGPAANKHNRKKDPAAPMASMPIVKIFLILSNNLLFIYSIACKSIKPKIVQSIPDKNKYILSSSLFIIGLVEIQLYWIINFYQNAHWSHSEGNAISGIFLIGF